MSKKYYKVVDKDLKSFNGRFQYVLNEWSHKSETHRGNPFFVFTDFTEAKLFRDNLMNKTGVIYECQVVNPYYDDDELGNISVYKNHSVFADKVKLTKVTNENRTELKAGMIFKVKRTKQYLLVHGEDNQLIYISGSRLGEIYQNSAYFIEELLNADDSLMYCKDAKISVVNSSK